MSKIVRFAEYFFIINLVLFFLMPLFLDNYEDWYRKTYGSSSAVGGSIISNINIFRFYFIYTIGIFINWMMVLIALYLRLKLNKINTLLFIYYCIKLFILIIMLLLSIFFGMIAKDGIYSF